ncbi:MAG: bifunctional riboflavin kinase/FAD synthetase [Dehalococcoidia bacterium]|nr:bifunctional riboflavin kinase/FAD synthetase [Dehalococcoidia bacterium]
MDDLSLKHYGNQIGECAITIGVFDGVHLGHSFLINQLIQQAQLLNLKHGVITFEPHPIKIINPKADFSYIQKIEEKVQELSNIGVDFISILQFDRQISEMTGHQFFKKLKEHIDFKLLLVGEDFKLGKNREAGIQVIEEISKELNFKMQTIPLQNDDAFIAVSSTKIRKFLKDGNIVLANNNLGRLFSITDIVKQGDQRGRQLGFPTINFDLTNDYIIPKKGVYATFTKIDDKKYKSITNIGIRPTFGKTDVLAETHVFDYNGDAYSSAVTIFFVDFIRNEVHFNNESELMNQINQDIIIAKKILS